MADSASINNNTNYKPVDLRLCALGLAIAITLGPFDMSELPIQTMGQ